MNLSREIVFEYQIIVLDYGVRLWSGECITVIGVSSTCNTIHALARLTTCLHPQKREMRVYQNPYYINQQDFHAQQQHDQLKVKRYLLSHSIEEVSAPL